MKNVLIFLMVMLFCLFNSNLSNAQTGWKWGRGATLYSTWPHSAEASPVTANKYGESFEATIIEYCDSVHMGGISIVDTAHRGQMVLITKIDSPGNYVWVNCLYGAITPLAIAADDIGNVYMMGSYSHGAITVGTYTFPDPTTLYSYLLVKISSSGAILWARSISDSGSVGITGEMCVDFNGNVYVTGVFKGVSATIGTSVLVNHDTTGVTQDIFVAKYNASGSCAWAHGYGTISDDYDKSISRASDGYFYFGGRASYYDVLTIDTTSINGYDGFYVKADTNGNIIWVKALPANTRLSCFTSDESGNLYITGNVMGGGVWAGTDYLYPTSISCVFIFKADSTGNLLWGKEGESDDISMRTWAIVADRCGKVWIGGGMGTYPSTGTDTINFNGHTLTPPPGSFDPIFLVQYDTAGNYLSNLTLPSGGDEPNGVALDKLGNLFVCGDYTHCQMTFAHDTLPYISSNEGLFVGRYKYDASPCMAEVPLAVPDESNTALSNIMIFPNPAFNECTIQSIEKFPAGASAGIYDLTGRLLREFDLSCKSTVISVKDFTPGMYTCRIVSDNNEVVKKLVVMK